MRVLAVVVTWCLLMPYMVNGQPAEVAQECSRAKIFTASAKTTLASADELKYDVKHVHLEISLDNTSVAIAGKATTTALVTEGNFALYVFELNSKLAIDSIVIDGTNATFTRADNNMVNTFMPVLLQTGEVFMATVYYHGVPDAGSVFFFQSGVNNAPAVEWNSPVTYTLSEPFNSKDWWPCKQYLDDKIDSAEIWITVPDTLKAGSNGLLQQVTPLPGNKKRFEWKTNYPVAYYLLSVSVAAYDDYSFTRIMPDGKQVLVQNYLYSRPRVLDSFKNRIDTTGEMLYYFSGLFGTYPFYKEKYGHCMAPVFGGMEHQTMTTLHNFNAALVAHELAHQWFGDNVTCGTWRDVWLNEGFASYAEYLYAEKFWGEEAGLRYMQKVHGVVLDDTLLTGIIYMSEAEAENPYRIFDNRLSYQKASAVLHMLRYIINDDDLFFSILQRYQQQYAHTTATTNDFKQLVERLSGLDLQHFFDQWIYGEGYPVYNIKWNQLNNKLLLQIQQQGCVPASVPQFNIPVTIKLISGDGDTTIRLPDGISQYTEISIQRKIDNIIFDPKDALLNKETVNRDYALGINTSPDGVYVYPNPAANDWNVINIAAGSKLLLTDLHGRKIWTRTVTDNYGVSIPAEGYARGMYLLRITDSNNKTTSIKLIRL